VTTTTAIGAALMADLVHHPPDQVDAEPPIRRSSQAAPCRGRQAEQVERAGRCP
jgi:hypothetical protein